jgi:hypothetical protein
VDVGVVASGITSLIAISSDPSIAQVEISPDTITVYSPNDITGTTTITLSGEVDKNYIAPEYYPSIIVDADFTPDWDAILIDFDFVEN